jgi:hypothetical protein
MDRLDLEDRRTERLWSIRLTVVCAALIASLLTIVALTSKFPEPQAADQDTAWQSPHRGADQRYGAK